MKPHRIPLDNTSFEGKNNAYLLDGDETVLIDSGVRTAETRSQLQHALARMNIGFDDIDRVFLTHWHQDHCGLAGEIQEQGGSKVYVHEADAPLVAMDPNARESLESTHEEYFDRWGMPRTYIDELREVLDGSSLQSPVENLELLNDGETYSVGELDLEVIHAPGHSAGLCCFAFDGPNGREVFTGDAILPVYTPNVGGADVRVEDPLEKYIETLQRLSDAGFERAWPGHRDPIAEPTGRAQTIIEHHEKRAWNVLEALEELGPSDTWTVSRHLFGDLDSIHILHGPGEAHAHLGHLEATGAIEKTSDGYRLRPETQECIDSCRENQRWPL